MNMNNLRIGPRLSLGFGFLLVLMLATVAIGLWELNSANQSSREMAARQTTAATSLDWVAKTRLNITRMVAIAKSGGQPEIDAYFMPAIKQTSAEITELQKAMQAQITSADGKLLLDTAVQRRAEYLVTRDGLTALLKQQADRKAIDAHVDRKLLPAADLYLAAMTSIHEHEVGVAKAAADALDRGIVRAAGQLTALLCASLVCGAVIAWAITRSVTLPLRVAVASAEAIAGGDLSRPVGSARRDEPGELLRAVGAMQASLCSVVGEVREATHSVGTASAEIATGTLDLSSRTEQTAANLQETAASMENLTSAIRQTTESAHRADEMARSAGNVAGRGGAVVAEVVSTMGEIDVASRRIADIVGTIDSLAFQTNILALNAAVEAARAGEQGRGFAVVASEVRSLAQRSATASKEIRVLIGASVDKVRRGTELVGDAGRTMTEIVTSVQSVGAIVGEITVASDAQRDGLGQINAAVGQLDQMTQQNAALVEESSAAAESLRGQTARLERLIGTFRLDTAAAPA
jgi:methyl-accepting chemotaxis protein